MSQFEDMQTFIRIVDAGSITKAAEQMDTVKSVVSRRLMELEKRLGITLLTRTTRSQTLTDSGKSYYQQCLRILDDMAEVESSLRNEHCALSGRIKIAAPLSFGLKHLGAALKKFNDIHPDIFFELDFNDRIVDLIEEGFDLAIRIGRLEDSTLITKRFMVANGILCASPAYLKKHGKPARPADLMDVHVKLNYSGTRDSFLFKKDGEETQIKVPSVLTANNGDYLCQLAVDGKGLVSLPDFICYEAIRSGKLVPVLEDYLEQNEINGYLLYPQTRHLSQRVRTLVDYLAAYFGDKPYWQLD